MKTPSCTQSAPVASRFWLPLSRGWIVSRLALLCSLASLPLVAPLQAAPSTPSTPSKPTATTSLSLPPKITATGVEFAIPSGCTSCVVDLRLKNSKSWLRWRTFAFNGNPTSISLSTPKGLAITEWRATATINSEKAQARAQTLKFPERFYQGSRTFAASPAMGYGVFSPLSSPQPQTPGDLIAFSADLITSPSTSKSLTAVSALSSTTQSTTNTPPSASIAEADIWKTRGSTIFFFNQLRGLQVLDLTTPAQPLLLATYRMPASGQDMYLLPSQNPNETLVVLLLQKNDGSTEVAVLSVTGRSVQELSRSPLPGYLSDSRMLGNRLYVASSNWNASESSITLSEILIQPDGSQTTGILHKVPNTSSSILSAGDDWLTIASSSWNDWEHSQLTAFRLDPKGATLLTPTPIATKGRIYDKFKVTLQGSTLRAISQSYENGSKPNPWGWIPRIPLTTLENFDLSGTRLGSLEIIRDENLYATRFTPEKLYAVTFHQIDPLWVIDLSDNAAPRISGSVEVPGFSTYIEPLGDQGQFLFTIGLDAGKVVASLFNVLDPSKPTLQSRVALDEKQWGYSEAVWNEKALKVLPEDGLALIPFTSGSDAFVRLIDIRLDNGGSLTLRGRLTHAFEPRRATLLGGILTSISQKQLVTANIDDRDTPKLLADVDLAWPVNRLFQSGDYLLQLSDGSSSTWSGEPASLRVSPSTSENSILNEISLGEGAVHDAALRNGKLFVLRKNWSPFISMRMFMPQAIASSSSSISASTPQLSLDIYDASQLPQLPLLGSTAIAMQGTETSDALSNLLWINDSLPAVLSQPNPGAFLTPWMGSAILAVCDLTPIGARPSRPNRSQLAIIRPFDVSNPKAPASLPALSLPDTSDTQITASAAGDNLLVFGFGKNPRSWKCANWPLTQPAPTACSHYLGSVNFSTPSKPVINSPVSLPGRLFALADISRSGFLAYTESVSTPDPAAPPTRSLQANLITDGQASLIASTEVSLNAQYTTQNRSLFILESQTLLRKTLDDNATWTENGKVSLPWMPTHMTPLAESLLLTDSQHVARVSWPALSPLLETWNLNTFPNSPLIPNKMLFCGLSLWNTSRSNPASRITLGSNRSLWIPQDDFGIEHLLAK